jgi:hypothetical protein
MLKTYKRKKQWYLKNKEKILQKQKEIIVCKCGVEIRKAGFAEHCRSQKHINFIQ